MGGPHAVVRPDVRQEEAARRGLGSMDGAVGGVGARIPERQQPLARSLSTVSSASSRGSVNDMGPVLTPASSRSSSSPTVRDNFSSPHDEDDDREEPYSGADGGAPLMQAASLRRRHRQRSLSELAGTARPPPPLAEQPAIPQFRVSEALITPDNAAGSPPPGRKRVHSGDVGFHLARTPNSSGYWSRSRSRSRSRSSRHHSGRRVGRGGRGGGRQRGGWCCCGWLHCGLGTLLAVLMVMLVGMWWGCKPHERARGWSAAELAAVQERLEQIDQLLDHVAALKTDMSYLRRAKERYEQLHRQDDVRAPSPLSLSAARQALEGAVGLRRGAVHTGRGRVGLCLCAIGFGAWWVCRCGPSTSRTRRSTTPRCASASSRGSCGGSGPSAPTQPSRVTGASGPGHRSAWPGARRRRSGRGATSRRAAAARREVWGGELSPWDCSPRCGRLSPCARSHGESRRCPTGGCPRRRRAGDPGTSTASTRRAAP
jgi:hypothetical protein